MITDALLSEGQWIEGGAERHLWHLAKLASRCGVRVTIFQAASVPFDSHYRGVQVIGLAATSRNIWARAIDAAVAGGATHLYFQNIDRVPFVRLPLPTSATNHGVFWDHPYDGSMAAWYPHGSVDRIALPVWRQVQRCRVIANVSRCTAVLSTDSSFYHVVQSQAPRLRTRVHVAYNFYEPDDPQPVTEVAPQSAREVLAPLHQARAEGRVLVLVPRNLSLVRGGGWLPRIVDEVTTSTGGRCQFALCGKTVQTQGRADRYNTAFATALAALPRSSRACLSLLGGVAHELMTAAYTLSDIVVIPTYSHESTSLAAIEAMARRRPVVATNVGGLSDVVADGWTGLLVPPTVTAIAAAITNLANDAEMRERLGAQAAIEASGRFTLARWEQRVLPFMERAGWLG